MRAKTSSGRVRRALFAGTSSSLSPKAGRASASEPFEADGQLMAIISVMGTPSVEEMAQVEDPKARAFLQTMLPQRKQEFSSILPNVGEAALDLLEKMLQFDPNVRSAVDETIAHPYFEGCIEDPATYGDLRQSVEKLAESPVELDFDNDLEAWGATPSVQTIKWRTVKEIKKFHGL